MCVQGFADSEVSKPSRRKGPSLFLLGALFLPHGERDISSSFSMHHLSSQRKVTESDRDENPNLNQSDEEYEEKDEEYVDERVHTPLDYQLTYEEKDDDKEKMDEEKMDEEDDDEVTKELYKDVNVNLGNRDADMTDADHGRADQQNVSQESGFEQVEEDAHVTLTLVLDTQKTDGTMQSSSVSSDFTSKLINLENPSPSDNEIASLMDTTIRHKEQGSQTSSLYNIPIMAVPKITFVSTTTFFPPHPVFKPLPQQATPTLTPTTSKATTSSPALPDFDF
ncbi:hypothetical protein Tco_1340238, partial [Tanacetum coccineum]